MHSYHNWHPDNGPNPLNRADDRGNAILEIAMKKPEEAQIELSKVKDKLGSISGPTLAWPENFGENNE